MLAALLSITFFLCRCCLTRARRVGRTTYRNVLQAVVSAVRMVAHKLAECNREARMIRGQQGLMRKMRPRMSATVDKSP